MTGAGARPALTIALALVLAEAPMIPATHAYKVERVCVQETSKQGTSEKCKTKLVPGSEETKSKTAASEEKAPKGGSK